jgi:putative ABC transport system permease protein
MAEELAMPRFALALMSVFGILALLLASVGVYGLVAFTVARRSREIGVRMAMGATTRTVVFRVLRSGLGLAVAGVMLGIGGALVLSRYLGSLLFGISRLDAATYAMVVLILLLTTTLALLRPALRAGRLEPYRALRDE